MCCSIAKYLLFLFNFVFWLAGCAIMGVGIWLTVDEDVQKTVDVLGETVMIETGAIVLIVAGAIMLLFGFVGCCGAIKESTCLLGTYSGLLVIVLGLEIGIGIWALIEFNTVGDAVDAAYDALDDPDETFVPTEQNFKCCGYNHGCTDWIATPVLGCNCTEGEKNCISTDNADPTCNFGDVALYYNQTCATAMTNFIEDNMTIIGWVAIGIGLIELVGIIISIGLCCHIKDENKGHKA